METSKAKVVSIGLVSAIYALSFGYASVLLARWAVFKRYAYLHIVDDVLVYEISIFRFLIYEALLSVTIYLIGYGIFRLVFQGEGARIRTQSNGIFAVGFGFVVGYWAFKLADFIQTQIYLVNKWAGWIAVVAMIFLALMFIGGGILKLIESKKMKE